MGLSKLTIQEPIFESRFEVEIKSMWSDCRSFKHEVLTGKQREKLTAACADYKIHCRACSHWVTLGGRGEHTSRVVLPGEDSLGNHPPLLSPHWLEYASEGMNFPVLQACLSRAKRKPQGNGWLLLAEGHHYWGTNTICQNSLMGNKLTS